MTEVKPSPPLTRAGRLQVRLAAAACLLPLLLQLPPTLGIGIAAMAVLVLAASRRAAVSAEAGPAVGPVTRRGIGSAVMRASSAEGQSGQTRRCGAPVESAAFRARVRVRALPCNRLQDTAFDEG